MRVALPIEGVRAQGAKLLGGTGSLQGAAARFVVGETNTDNRTYGGLISEQIAWRDRLFFTAAVRTDRNSAFGQDFGFVTYPAASLSYVISDELARYAAAQLPKLQRKRSVLLNTLKPPL